MPRLHFYFYNPVETGYLLLIFFIHSPIYRAYKIINLARSFMAGRRKSACRVYLILFIYFSFPWIPCYASRPQNDIGESAAEGT